MSKKYIDNEEFEELILSYKEEPEKFEEELVKMFELLIDNIIASFKFQVDPLDAKQECFTLLLKTVKNFKPRKGTAFNYFTTVTLNQLKLMFTKEKRYQEKIKGYIELKKGDLEE